MDPQVRTQPFPHPVDEQPATVIHVQVISTTSVTDGSWMPAASSRWTILPARGKF